LTGARAARAELRDLGAAGSRCACEVQDGAAVPMVFWLPLWRWRRRHTGAMGHGISIEVWTSRFATALCGAQPSVDHALALDLAAVVHPSLGVLRPEAAAQTFLEVQLRGYQQAGDAAAAVLRSIRDADRS
jgi:hypothetical protein